MVRSTDSGSEPFHFRAHMRLQPALLLPPGLCGNFNSMQADDFQTISGVVEGTAAAFFNTFKTQAACPNVKNIFQDPCSLSVENGEFVYLNVGLCSIECQRVCLLGFICDLIISQETFSQQTLTWLGVQLSTLK